MEICDDSVMEARCEKHPTVQVRILFVAFFVSLDISSIQAIRYP